MQECERKTHKNQPDLLMDRALLILHDNLYQLTPGKGCDQFSELLRIVNVSSCALQSRHDSTRLAYSLHQKSLCRNTVFSCGRDFLSGIFSYSSHLRTEQKWYSMEYQLSQKYRMQSLGNREATYKDCKNVLPKIK